TQQFEYPERPVPVKPRYRGFHRFDLTTCIGCDKCAKACPVDCIYIDKMKNPVGKGFRVTGFKIDYTKCMFCALCVDPCPVGCFLRPSKMDAEKGSIYECGEPTVGSAWVQFDLRFYVVALLFVIFDVEMAFFFPWAVVFGQANQLADPRLPAEVRAEKTLNFYVPPVNSPDPNWAKDPATFRKLLTIDPA